MLIVSYLLIGLLSILFSLALYRVCKKLPQLKTLILKVSVLMLAGVVFLRYMSVIPALSDVRGLNMFSIFGDDIFKTIVGILLIWFNYASILMIIMSIFFEYEMFKKLVRFFAIPVLLLEIIFFKIYAQGIFGIDVFKQFDPKILFVIFELVLAIGVSVNQYCNKDYLKFNKKEVLPFIVALLFGVLVFMPVYVPQALFGFADSKLHLTKFSFEHRLVLYASVIVPILIFKSIKRFDVETKRVIMIYFSIALAWSFTHRFTFEALADPTKWPLHLCNTIMYVMPVCLIFRLNKVFYFTLFINVLGAALAMFMPNTASNANILDTGVVLFWINHHAAFYMPILTIACKIFERPKLRQWGYSVAGFAGYFILVLVVNSWFSNYGEVDFFFLNSDFIVDKLGEWARDTLDIVWSFKVGELTLTFYPLYQTLFFLVYVVLSVAIWFLYEQIFMLWVESEDRALRMRDYRQMKKDLAEYLKLKECAGDMNENVKPCLELKSFSKRYGMNKHYSVHNASLKVEGGEIFGFLGPNGAGKSTIIKSIVGIQTITEGNIEVCGYDVEKESVKAKKEIGFVPDHYALYENLTGREYVNYIADLYGVNKEERDERIEKLVKNFNLTEAFDNQMKTYSHGMKQKITIMSALVHNPKVWILDEPLTGLDPNSIFEVKECMREHAKAGNIVFFSSHIIDVVERICDRIAIIKKGNILDSIKVSELEAKNISLEDYYMNKINGEEIKEEKVCEI